MKQIRFFLLLIPLVLAAQLNAQQRGLFINDSAGGIYVGSAASIYVDGDFQLLKAFPLVTNKLINGRLTITGNLVTDDSLYCDRGDSLDGTPPSILRFAGNGDSYVRGMNKSTFYQVVFDKTSGNVYIENDMQVEDTITFLSGNAIIAQPNAIHLVYRQGTNNVPANPYIIGENAQHRFLGDGVIRTDFLIEAGRESDVAGTGFHFHNHMGDTLFLVRGHNKQLYAGNGGLDRYFDVEFIGANAALVDTLGLNYLHDVNYAITGVDTARLALYVSSQFADMDFRRIDDERDVLSVDYSVTDPTAFDDPTVAITSNHFRLTAGDTACIQPPLSNLPSTVIHLCAGDSLLVTAENTITYGFENSVDYFWLHDSLDLPSRYVYPQATQQDLIVKLIDSRGCYSYDTVTVAPTAPDPNVAFSWADACFGDSVRVTDQTTIASGTFTSSWNFGNGDTSASQTDTLYVSYAAPGSYTVTLTSVSNYGCEASISNVVDMFNLPVADIGTSINCFNQTIFFDGTGSTGTTIPANYNITDYNWNIDAGAITQTNASFTQPMLLPGTHQVELQVESGVGCRDTLLTTLVIAQPDTAGFTVTTACAGSPIGLANTSFVVNPNPQYQWSFSDATTDTVANPVKTFATPGIKTIQLILQTDGACADTFSTSIVVSPLPDPSFTVSGLCLGQQYTFQASTVSGTNTYTWNLSDGAVLSGAVAQHTFAAAGTFTATLTVTNAQTCTAQSTQNVVVNTLPVPSFNATAVCEGSPSTLVSTSSGTGLTYAWNFGDFSATGSGLSVQHTYAANGSYNVQLSVTNSTGCSATITQPVTVHDLPQLNLGTISTCSNSYVLDAENPGSTYLWWPMNDTTQSITATNSGTYSVTVIDGNGCEGTGQANLTLNTVVQPDLGPDTSICGEITFSAGYNGADFEWQDGSTGQTFTANAAGTYWVEVTDQNGCVGSDTVVIPLVYPFVQPDLGADQSVCETDFPVQLSAGAFDSYNWSNGSSGTTYSVSGTASVWVEVTDVNGCSGRDTISVVSMNSPASILPASVSSCDEVTLVASGDPGDDVLWSTSEPTNIITVTSSGEYSVIIEDVNTGCQVFDTIDVLIQASPIVELGPNLSVCSNAPVTLDASNPGATYEWTSTSGAVISTSATYVPISSGTYLVTVSNASCSASDAITVTLLPSPVIPEQPPTFYICGTTPVNLEGCDFSANTWTGPNGFSSSDAVVSTYETGNYTVVSNVGTCTATRSFTLETSPNQLEAFYLVDSDTLINLSIKFIDLSEPTPISYLWDFGDGTSDTTASPVHQYSVVDVYNTSLTVSNGICISTFTKTINQKTFFPDGVSSSSPALELVDYNLYPNPATNVVHFGVQLSDEANNEIVLYDMLGHILYRYRLDNASAIELDIPVDTLAVGSYFIRLNAESLKGNVVRNYKIIKSD